MNKKKYKIYLSIIFIYFFRNATIYVLRHYKIIKFGKMQLFCILILFMILRLGYFNKIYKRLVIYQF